MSQISYEKYNLHNKMRVLWFAPTPGMASKKLGWVNFGGSWIKSLEKALKDITELHIAFYHDGDSDEFEIEGVKYYPIKNKYSNYIKKIYKNVFSILEPTSDVKEYLDIIKKVDPDIIHIHGSENPFGLIIGKTQIPIVISMQGIINVYVKMFDRGIPIHASVHHASIKSRLLFKTFGSKYTLMQKQAEREKQILKEAKHIIGRTEWDKRVTSILAPNAKYYHNGEILRNSFYNNEWKDPNNERMVLFTTNGPNLYKGVETILECCSLLDEYGLKYIWKVAGLAKDDELIKIAAKSKRIKVSENLFFLSKLSEYELLNGLLESNIYVGVSHIENSPNSLCEAQMIGIPCIATFAGGTSSILENGKEGILFQDGDALSLAGAILEYQTDYDEAKRFGENGRKRAINRHNIDMIRKELISLYDKIIRSNRCIKH